MNCIIKHLFTKKTAQIKSRNSSKQEIHKANLTQVGMQGNHQINKEEKKLHDHLN